MREGGQTQGLESVGDARSGVFLLLAGAALLGSTLTGVWSGPVVVPTALAIPLLAFYEISILIGRRIEKRREAAEKKAEDDANKAEAAGS